MTANLIKGKSFRGALRYNLDKLNRGVAEILSHNFCSTREHTILKEINHVRILRPNLTRYFYHNSINFPPSESIPNNQMMQIGLDYLQAAGFNQHQYIMFRHHDTNHPHLHILVNRIGFDGSVVSDSNDYARTEHILRSLENKYNLTSVAPSRQAQERAVTKNELEMMKRTKQPSHKTKLQWIIKTTLHKHHQQTLSQFVQALKRNGIHAHFNIASTGYISGITYQLQDFIITGSKLGNDFKWTSIKNKINYNQKEDHQFILQWNAQGKERAQQPTKPAVHSRSTYQSDTSPSTHASNTTQISKTATLTIPDLQAPPHQPDNLSDPAFQFKPKRRKKRRARKT